MSEQAAGPAGPSGKDSQHEAAMPVREAIMEREAMLLRRAAAYGFFVVAGWALASAAWILLDDVHGCVSALMRPWRMDFWLLALPGPAAALGAAAVHRPFMRAVHARRDPYAHAWAVAGVLAAHAAYAALVFALELAGAYPAPGHASVRAGVFAVLFRAGGDALGAGLFSLIAGFLPNVLIGTLFTGFMLSRQIGRARQGTESSLLAKGADHASSILAE